MLNLFVVSALSQVASRVVTQQVRCSGEQPRAFICTQLASHGAHECVLHKFFGAVAVAGLALEVANERSEVVAKETVQVGHRARFGTARQATACVEL